MADEVINLVELDRSELLSFYLKCKEFELTSAQTGDTDESAIIVVLETKHTVVNAFISHCNQISTTISSGSITETIASRFSLTTEMLLNCLLDWIFANVNDNNPYDENGINFGVLLREFIMLPEDVDDVEHFLITSTDKSAKSMFLNLYHTGSQLKLALAILYSYISKQDLRLLYESASYIASPQLSRDEYEAMMHEFTMELQQAKKESHDLSVKNYTSRITESDKHLEAVISTVEVTLLEVMGAMASYDNLRQPANDLLAKFNSAIDGDDNGNSKNGASEMSELVDGVNELVRHIAISADSRSDVKDTGVVPSSSQRDDGVLCDITEIRSVCRNLPLQRSRPITMIEPVQNDKVIVKYQGTWQTAMFVKFLDEDSIEVTLPTLPGIFLLPATDFALNTVPTWYLKIGEFALIRGNNNRWEPAVVVDQPSISRNNGRYLIFTFDGDAAYVDYVIIRCLWFERNRGYDYIRDTSIAEFVRQICEKYPEKAVVRLKVDERVRLLDKQNVWRNCTVMEIDGLMARLRLPNGHFTWVYRGDKRLEPIHVQHSNRRSRIMRALQTSSTGDNAPVIEYVEQQTDDESDFMAVSGQLSPRKRKIPRARKSVCNRPAEARKRASLQNGETLIYEQRRLAHVSETLLQLSDKHTNCSQLCLKAYESLNSFRNENPLLIPMLCGWQRLTRTARNRSGIVYMTPCNRTMRHPKHVSEYLLATESELTVDLFCFDEDLDPTRSIKPANPIVRIEDISDGRENVRVQCINTVNNEKPPAMMYSSVRFSSDASVDLEAAREFLCGCRCTDNCADSKKCECKMMTLSEATVMNDTRKSAYMYRRLAKPVPTGIYECNRFCPCDKRCSNRVVQHPMMNRLQVFRTQKKGWGVRALDDIPRGGFVCTYAGNVLSDALANTLGEQQGDEYFADLDLVQLIEKHKEGYEEEAIEDDDEEEESSTSSKRPRLSSVKEQPNSIKSNDGTESRWLISKYLGDDLSLYILDAKVSGNIGRYFNHSCSPNIFVQNVFVDTHDLRLPWVAFFAEETIKAGTEMCWDYRYIPGSIPGRTLACNCGTKKCRKRLL